MAGTLENAYHSKQIERYLSQVIRAFSSFYVVDGVMRDGSMHTEKVPVIFGSPSRVVAAMLSKDDEFKNIKAPMMSVSLSSIEPDDEGKLNRYHENELSFRDRLDGQLKNVDRRVGVSLRMSVDLNIYASSVSQLMEIFEQVALTFNPEVAIQKSTDVHDSDYITSIRLEGISPDISFPLGQNNRATQMSLQFSVPVRLSYPHNMKDPLEEIRVKVFETSNNPDEVDNPLSETTTNASEDSETIINVIENTEEIN